LSGGLGNQLFQASAGRKLALTEEIILLPNLGKAVTLADGIPEISDFNLEDLGIKVDGKKFSRIQIYFARQILMMSSVDSRRRFKFLAANFLKRVNELILGILISERIQSPSGVGFDSSFYLKPGTTLLIGNFHSHHWVSEDFKEKLRMRNSRSSSFSALESEAKNEKPIGVHVRLGDYLSIDELNVLDRDYYSRAIDDCKKEFGVKATWIFTNDPTRLNQYLHSEFILESKIVDLNLSSSETLELMRNCSAVVTANSTFSWWGAYSSHEDNVAVIAPNRWFRTNSNPIEVTPETWIRVDNG
jgi:Glycosyl transferase family 11